MHKVQKKLNNVVSFGGLSSFISTTNGSWSHIGGGRQTAIVNSYPHCNSTTNEAARITICMAQGRNSFRYAIGAERPKR